MGEPAAFSPLSAFDRSASGVVNAKVLSELASLIDTGRLEIPIAKIYHLADVREAYQDLARRHTRGKIVLDTLTACFSSWPWQPTKRPEQHNNKDHGDRRRAVALRLDAMFRGRREVDDRINPIGRDTEFERQIHIAAAERVDEGIDFACGCGSDSIRDAFPISDWDHTVVGEPVMVCCAGETDDLTAENFGQLDGDGAHATYRTRDDNSLVCLQRDSMHRRIR